jgi:hypothetical protein
VSKTKTLARLAAVRGRLRDAAAAAAAVAAQNERTAQNRRDARASDIDTLDGELLQRLTVARAQHALELFHADRDHASAALASATTDWQGRHGEASKARQALASRERDLQVAEKVLTDARDERARRIAKDEQATADDLSGARTTRRRP